MGAAWPWDGQVTKAGRHAAQRVRDFTKGKLRRGAQQADICLYLFTCDLPGRVYDVGGPAPSLPSTELCIDRDALGYHGLGHQPSSQPTPLYSPDNLRFPSNSFKCLFYEYPCDQLVQQLFLSAIRVCADVCNSCSHSTRFSQAPSVH